MTLAIVSEKKESHAVPQLQQSGRVLVTGSQFTVTTRARTIDEFRLGP
jgi:hypothetical protein